MLRGAIIGFGQVACLGHWPAYAKSPDVEIVAVVDPTEERRAAARETIPGVATFSTLEELRAHALQIDFVDICTPPALHLAPILAALATGWNVLCEKPLLLDLAELEQVRHAIRASGRAVVPVHNWKYAPIVRRATELLRAGRIGVLRGVEIDTLRIQDCAVADPKRPNWRRDPVIAGGGILMDHGWHAIYLAQHWFDEWPNECKSTLHHPAPDAVEDEAGLTLSFPSGRAEVFLTWRAEERRNTMRLVGTTGEILVNDGTLEIGNETIRFEPALSAGSHHADWFAAMLPDVLAYFAQLEKACASFAEAEMCLSIICRAYQQDNEAKTIG